MHAWSRILCAVDFSQPSRLAMETAADLARRYEAQLTLLHVNDVGVKHGEVLLAPPELFEAESRHEERQLEQWRIEAQHLTAKPVQALLLRGDPADVIARNALERPFDVVVIATHGRTGFKRLVLGSVAEHVVRTAPCPVLVVRSAGEPKSR
jgi:universal stress protein A